jgi:uncharacterized radical SAM superfamily protein
VRGGAGLAALAGEAGLSDAAFAALRAAGAAHATRPLAVSTPSFRHFESDALGTCAKSTRFPAFSITGGACALNCAHCRAEILKPMIPAGAPDAFEAKLRGMIGQGLGGFLLSGGSNLRNEVPFDRYLPVIRRLKDAFPHLEILAHTGLVDAARARALCAAGVDAAMLDIIGSQQTIREVYHLDRPVADFEASLAALVATGMTVVPHIVAGLHFGTLLGECEALRIIARHRTAAAILVVVMPAFADPRFQAPDLGAIAAFFAEARDLLNDRQVILGCARPHGRLRVGIDVAAVLAGFDGIAYPADEALEVARQLGRPYQHGVACCGTTACKRAA